MEFKGGFYKVEATRDAAASVKMHEFIVEL